MTTVCQRQECGAELTLPLPDTVGTGDETLERGVDLADADARERLRGYSEAFPCPSCEYLPLRVPVD
jgi:hypothetical protein